MATKKNTGTLGFRGLVAIVSMLTGLCILLPPSVLATQTLVISTMSLPDGTAGQAYSAQLNTCLFDTQASPPQCAADTSTSTWSVMSFSLPAGLTLTSSGTNAGLISGTPTNAATYSFTVEATNGTLTAQKIFCISIATPASTACGAPTDHVCWYVSTSGNNSNPGTRTSPLRTIPCGADKAGPGDWVVVLAGAYSHSQRSDDYCDNTANTSGKLVCVTKGGTSASLPVVFVSDVKWGAVLDGGNNTLSEGWHFYDGTQSGACENVASTSADYITVQCFEIKGFSETGFSNYGGGHNLDFVQNHIHDIGRQCTDSSTGRDGIFLGSSNVTVERNLIHDVGRFAPGENSCSLSSNNFEANDHGVYVGKGQATMSSNITVQNNVFYNIEHGFGVQIYNGSNTTVNLLNVMNNTFGFANPWRNGQIVVSVPVTSSSIENNIFYQGKTAAIYFSPATVCSSPNVCSLTIKNNMSSNLWGVDSNGVQDPTISGVTVAGNQENTDPLLYSPAIYDFHLTRNSTAIDGGLTLSGVTNDYEGVARPQGAAYDIGAYEFHVPFY